jgi:hypothetical protein
MRALATAAASRARPNAAAEIARRIVEIATLPVYSARAARSK